MSERQVTIGSKVGLHARPASLFAKAVKDAGVPVNAASLLSLLTLGAEFGDEVTLSAEGEGAETALDGLAEMLGRDLDAE
jgi:phosphocarrier protein HPr